MIDIETKDLKIGMYVAHLDRPWLETTFMFQGFLIENESQIEQLQRVCKMVKIDSEQSAPTLKLRSELTPEQQFHETAQNNKKSFEQEMAKARHVYQDASLSLHKVLNNFRINNYITLPEVKSCVHGVINSVMHNPGALLLLSTLRSKRQDTVTHSINTCVFSTLFGHALGLNSEQLSQLSIAAFLHDIGEAKVSKAILDKHTDDLTPEEQEQVQLHTQYGAEMLQKIPEMPAEAAEAAYTHHERIDGTGYPRGLKGSELSLITKIIAITDSYERLTNNNDPKKQVSCSDALKTLYALRSTSFDSELVEGFIKCLGIYPVGSVVKLNNGAIGIVVAMKPDKHLLPTVMVIRDHTGEIRRTPQVINLDRFRDKDGRPLLLISKVIDPSTMGEDLREQIIKELGIKVASIPRLEGQPG